MNILSTQDLFTARRLSLIADYDKETIFNLYQPIIGAVASALYLTLLVEAKNQRVLNYMTHEDLLIKMQLNTQEFLKARYALEAMGLLRTYLEDSGDDVKIYHYDLYAPKTPKSFFDDVLLYGTLIKYIGETNANKLNTLYKDNKESFDGVEISKTFGNYFHPDLNDKTYINAINKNKNKGRKTAKIDSEFNYDKFFVSLEQVSQIKKTGLTKEEVKEIERLSSLYGVDEITAANIVSTIYDPSKEKGSRIDGKRMMALLNDESNYRFLVPNEKVTKNEQITSDSMIAKKIECFDKIPPIKYLSILQNNTQPSSVDVRIVNSLSSKYGLPNPVINVLIDYCLRRNNNILIKAYVEKIAASILRENIKTSLEAMNYLYKHSGKNNRKVTKDEPVKGKQEQVIEDQIEEEEDSMTWEELFNEIEGA